MTRLSHDLIIAPVGIDLGLDPAQMQPGQAQQVTNLLADRQGRLRGQAQLVNLALAAFVGPIQGVGWLYNPNAVTGQPGSPPLLIVAANGTIYSFPLNCPQLPPGNPPITYPPTFATSGVYVGTSTGPGVQGRIRFAGFGSELYAVQEGNGVVNYRIQATGGLVALGLSIPAIGIVGTPAGTVTKVGKRLYVATFVDGLGRESSPTLFGNAASFDFGAGSAVAPLLQVTADNSQASKVYFYATAGNSPGAFFRIGQANVTVIGGNVTLQDDFTDAVVASGSAAPTFGENDIPLPASLLCVHKSRLFMNVTNAPGALQISNAGSATQFNSVPGTANPQDGVRLQLSLDQGNFITGFASFQNLLAIFLRRGLWFLSGEDPTDWDLKPAHEIGCIAADSVAHVGNHLLWLGDDGVYIGVLGWRFEVEKIGKPIEAAIHALNATPAGRAQLEAAQAWFVNNVYHLSLGNTVYRYDIDSKQWSGTLVLGQTVASALVVQQPGLPSLVLLGRSDSPTVSLLDIYTPNVAVSGMVYRTRAVLVDPGERGLPGPQTPRTLRKRVRRVRVFGSGTPAAGSALTLTVDGRAETYAFPFGSDSAQGLLIQQEFTPAMTGRLVEVTLNLSGTGIDVRDIEVQYVAVG